MRCAQVKTEEELEVMQYANDVASAAHVQVNDPPYATTIRQRSATACTAAVVLSW